MRKLSLLLAVLGVIFLAAPALATGGGGQFKPHHNQTNCNGLLNCNTVSDNNAVLGDGNVVGNTTDIKDNTTVLGDAIVGEGDLSVMGGSVGDTTSTSSAMGIMGQMQGIAGSGNSSIEEGAINQTITDGAVTVMDGPVNVTDGDVSTSTSTSQDQAQDQSVGIDQEFSDDDEINFDNSDHSVHSIDNDFPVNTAAPVFAGNCSQGVSAQTMSFGGSIASGNPVCDFIAVAGARIAGGDREGAFNVLDDAEDYAKWRSVFGKIRMVLTLGLL